MLLPTKYITEPQTLLASGGIVLSQIKNPCTLTALWERTCKIPQVGTFERLIITLDMLYILGAIDISQGLIRKIKQ
ncbi:MAG: hypothetical protein LBC74_02410 [Planctomycetaceae bacterium]|jgi:hypothetical protein|nr:hypothetical protein [Planctomycetaceae bacterium]